MAKSSFVVRVLLKGKDDGASKALGKTEKSADKLSTVLKLKLAAAAAVVVVAMKKLVDIARASTEAYSVQEDAVNKLHAALVPLTDDIDGVSEALEAEASALQQVTRFGDEAIIAAQAYLATLGVTAAQLPEATRATVDLAAAMGVSLSEAARNVGKTVGGFAGELGEVIPELKKLSTEALQAGEGITLLGEKFAGRAAADAETFSGLVTQLSHNFGDLVESTGKGIATNEDLGASLADLKKALTSDGLISAFEIFGKGLGAVAAVGGTLLTGTAALVGSIGRFASNVIEATRALNEYGIAQGLAADQTDRSRKTHQGITDEVRAAADERIREIEGIRIATGSYASLAEQHGINEKSLISLTKLTLNSGKAVGILVKANERAADLERQLSSLRKEGAEALAAVGIRTELELSKALETVRTQQEQLIELERLGQISRIQLSESTRKLRIEEEALEAVLRGEVATVEQFKQSLDAAGVGLSGFAADTRDAANEMDLFTSSQDRAANSTRNLQQQTRGGLSSGLSGSSFPTTIGGGTFTTYIPFSRVGPGGAVQA